MNRGVVLGLLAVALVALALRCPDLGSRPMHNDEAVNAVKFRSLWERGDYQYDPNEHHGPALSYFTLLWVKLSRVEDFAHLDEARLRGLTVLFGVGSILLLALVADGLGRGATVCAGILITVSPAMVYYSRDYIHETLLAFFTLLALAGGWRYFRTRKLGWALLVGGAVGLMQCTKETFILPLAAMALALIVSAAWNRLQSGRIGKPSPKFAWHSLAAIGVWLAVVLLFFSSFFTNAHGLLDSVRTYLPWLHRAAGDSPHNHPWNFYLSRLLWFPVGTGRSSSFSLFARPVWSEGLILGLALAGLFKALAGKNQTDPQSGFPRFIAIYTLALTAIYSAIPYKTPWCLLGFWQGTILLAGAGAAALLQRAHGPWMKWGLGIVLLAGAADLAAQAWQASVTYAADRRNPYVYAQTSPNILELVDELEALARVDPQGPHLLVKVMAPQNDYWPLPWYLRAFDRVGWWSEMPPDPFAPVMIVSTQFKTDFERQGTHIMAGLFELRPQIFLELYVQSDLWRAYLDRQRK